MTKNTRSIWAIECEFFDDCKNLQLDMDMAAYALADPIKIVMMTTYHSYGHAWGWFLYKNLERKPFYD